MRGSQALPFAGMIMVVLVQASNMVVNKVAMSDGVNKYTLVFYCNALATLILLPFPFLSLRSESCPPLTLSTLRKLVLLALVGFAAQTCGYGGIDYSSPVLGTAMMNLIPAFTFILAIISRMEKVVWKSMGSQAKLIGTVTSILGAFIVTFYKGPSILSKLSPASLKAYHLLLLEHLLSPKSNWVLGGFLLASEAFLISLWYIIQAFILRDYPAVMNIMFFMQLFAVFISGLFTFIVVREPGSWALKFDMGLVAILYSAVIGGVFRVSLATWCLKQTGPVYVSMFKPIGIVFAVVLGFIFLGDKLYLGSFGSLIGAAVIVIGFYGVMWGKSREEDEEKTTEPCGAVGNFSLAHSHQDNNNKIPLLQSKDQSVDILH